MAKTSIHIKACDIAGSELHNERKRLLSYIRKELTQLNESYNYTGNSLSAELKKIRQDVKQLTGRKLQKNAIPIKEGVAVINEGTTMSDLQEFCRRCQEEFGMIPLQIHIHRDEGHTAAKTWKPNLHAHIVWRMYNEQGRNVRLSQADCAKMQTILSEVLGMERGRASGKKHLDAIQYKAEMRKKELKEEEQQLRKLGSSIDKWLSKGKEMACKEIMDIAGLKGEATASNLGIFIKDKLEKLDFAIKEYGSLAAAIQRRYPYFFEETKRGETQEEETRKGRRF